VLGIARALAKSLTGLLFATSAVAGPLATSEQKTLARFHDPVIVRGSDFTERNARLGVRRALPEPIRPRLVDAATLEREVHALRRRAGSCRQQVLRASVRFQLHLLQWNANRPGSGRSQSQHREQHEDPGAPDLLILGGTLEPEDLGK